MTAHHNIRPLPKSEIAKVVEMHGNGISTDEIARVLKRGKDRIRLALHSNGLRSRAPLGRTRQPAAPRSGGVPPVIHESYAVCADGGSLTVSHGISADAAERTLDALTRGRDVVRRGTARIGEWKRAGDVASDVVAGIAAKRTAFSEAAEEYRRERAASEKLAKEGARQAASKAAAE